MDILGKQARDKITGFTGIITARVDYLYGCAQYALTPGVSDGKLGETVYFDEGRIEITGDGVARTAVAAPVPGGPNRDAPGRQG